MNANAKHNYECLLLTREQVHQQRWAFNKDRRHIDVIMNALVLHKITRQHNTEGLAPRKSRSQRTKMVKKKISNTKKKIANRTIGSFLVIIVHKRVIKNCNAMRVLCKLCTKNGIMRGDSLKIFVQNFKQAIANLRVTNINSDRSALRYLDGVGYSYYSSSHRHYGLLVVIVDTVDCTRCCALHRKSFKSLFRYVIHGFCTRLPGPTH